MTDTEEKITKAVRLIQSYSHANNLTLAYSGGKDSEVLRFLIERAQVPCDIIYINTTIDPPGTIRYVKSKGARVLNPRMTFLDLVERKGLPSMFRRFCCAVLKEQYIAPYLLLGIRRSESVKRATRYTEPEICHIYKKGLQAIKILPMLSFVNEDVTYIHDTYNLKMHPLYYDEQGHFHVERRLGCLGCPLKADRGRADYLAYPKLLKAVISRVVKFHETHGRDRQEAYRYLVYNIFYSNHKHYQYCCTFEGLFENDPKTMLENYFKIELP